MSNFKLHEEHWLILVEFMENHHDFACGRLSSINGRETQRKLWTDLVNKLNSLGYGSRPIEKWQKCWADYKSNLKKKAAQIKSSQEKTGGGPALESKLNCIELRVLSIMGNTSYAGCGIKELGLEDSTLKMDTTNPLDSESQLITKNSMEKENVGTSMKRNIDLSNINDHDYLVHARSTKKKNLSNSQEEMYKETVELLKRIDNTLDRGLTNINETLNKNFATLCDILMSQETGK